MIMNTFSMFFLIVEAARLHQNPAVCFIVNPVITYSPLGEESGIGVPSYKVHEADKRREGRFEIV